MAVGYQGFTIIASDGHVTAPWSLDTTYTQEPNYKRARALVEPGQRQDGGVIAVLPGPRGAGAPGDG